mgnify:CR=1 FL=1
MRVRSNGHGVAIYGVHVPSDTPAILDDPVVLAVQCAVPDHRDTVVELVDLVQQHDPRLVDCFDLVERAIHGPGLGPGAHRDRRPGAGPRERVVAGGARRHYRGAEGGGGRPHCRLCWIGRARRRDQRAHT